MTFLLGQDSLSAACALTGTQDDDVLKNGKCISSGFWKQGRSPSR